MDPDAPEEDEDNDVEDADGDQDETELLWISVYLGSLWWWWWWEKYPGNSLMLRRH